MTDQDYLRAVDEVFRALESRFDALNENSDSEVDTLRQGNVLQIEFESGEKIIVNAQEPLKEIWVAARSGGFHYRYSGDLATPGWRDTRSGQELFADIDGLIEKAGAGRQ